MNPEKTKILIVKIGAIGDSVMALSMIHEIEVKYPDAEITWLCGEIILPLIKSVQRIDKIITLDENKLLAGSKIEQFTVILKVWTKLLFRKFDLVVNAHRDRRYDLLVLSTLKKEYRSFTRRGRNYQLVQGRYHAVEYARLIHNMDDWEMPESVFPQITVGQVKFIDKLLAESNNKRIILTPGGAQNIINDGIQRKWPTENYSLLAKMLLEKIDNCSIIIAGSKNDEQVLDTFKNLPLINLIGKTSLADLIYLYNGCNLLITHDTGLMHIAKLSEIHSIALFGPVNPVERVGKNERIETIWLGNELPCSPCYNGKSFAECANNICMKNISVNMVFERAIKVLKQIS